MATLADRVLDAIRYAPTDDDVLVRRLGVGHFWVSRELDELIVEVES